MKIELAKLLAEDLVQALRWDCERIEIAGSVRRGKPEVKDIEIVAIPKRREIKDLFGESIEISALDQFSWTLLGTLELNGPRQKKVMLYEGIALDLFIVRPPAQWGVIYAIRTGPADFSQWIVTPRKKGGALPSDCVVSDGRVLRYGKPIPMPEETDYLNLLGLGWIEPEDRKADWSSHE